MFRSLVFAVLLLALLLLGGCGGGGAALTKKQYVRRADAVCTRLSRKLVRESAAFEKRRGLNVAAPNQHEREEIIVGVLLPNIEERIDELKSLPAPKGDEAKVAQILSTLESGLRESRSQPTRSAAPDAHRGEPFRMAMDVAADYGIWLCGQAGG